MDNHVIETVDSESTDLKLHVDLCQQRYLQLIHKFDQVDERLDSLTTMIKELATKVDKNQDKTYRQYLIWAGFIISALTGIIVSLLIK